MLKLVDSREQFVFARHPHHLANETKNLSNDGAGLATPPAYIGRNAPTSQFVLNELAILVPICCTSSKADFS